MDTPQMRLTTSRVRSAAAHSVLRLAAKATATPTRGHSATMVTSYLVANLSVSFLKERPKSRGAGSKSRHDSGFMPGRDG